MSDEPQDGVWTDHVLNRRLAKLCGMPVTAYPARRGKEYPQVIVNSAGELIFVERFNKEESFDVIWNPLKDERHAFRYVVKALGQRGVSVTAWSDKSTEGLVRYGALAVDNGRCGKIISAGPWCDSVARAICLAALEAWEKLEKNSEDVRA